MIIAHLDDLRTEFGPFAAPVDPAVDVWTLGGDIATTPSGYAAVVAALLEYNPNAREVKKA